jgi:hypothetical protein
MAIDEGAWDGAASNYSDTAHYCSACLIDLNTAGEDKTQANCKLPVKTPSGATNRNAVHAAAAALAGGRGGVNAPPADKKKAARALMRLYGELKEDPPDSLKRLAG